MGKIDPVTGPLDRTALKELAAAPHGIATKTIRRFDPQWGRKEGAPCSAYRPIVIGSLNVHSQSRPHRIPTTLRRCARWGGPYGRGGFMHVVGNFSGVAQARKAMGIDWMVRDELREAIPPAYAKFIGRTAIEYLSAMRQAAK